MLQDAAIRSIGARAKLNTLTTLSFPDGPLYRFTDGLTTGAFKSSTVLQSVQYPMLSDGSVPAEVVVAFVDPENEWADRFSTHGLLACAVEGRLSVDDEPPASSLVLFVGRGASIETAPPLTLVTFSVGIAQYAPTTLVVFSDADQRTRDPLDDSLETIP